MLAIIGKVTVCVSRFSQHPRWDNHPNGAAVLIGISGEVSLVIWDEARTKTISLRAGEVAIISQNTWHSSIPNAEVSVLRRGDYGGTVVSDSDDTEHGL